MPHRVILIDILLKPEPPKITQNRLDELENLVNTYGGMVIIKKIQKKHKPDYQNFLSRQKMEELVPEAEAEDVDMIIINNPLKANQLYNLNEFFNKHEIEVWDRIDLILNLCCLSHHSLHSLHNS